MGTRSRHKAEQKAGELLAKLPSEPVTDEEILGVLRRWRFKWNKTRKNVIPTGKHAVHSDTLGLVHRLDGRLVPTRATMKHPSGSRWLRERRLPEFRMEFPHAPININYNYAAKLHRDGNNVGQSITKAFGDFDGGQLFYWRSSCR